MATLPSGQIDIFRTLVGDPMCDITDASFIVSMTQKHLHYPSTNTPLLSVWYETTKVG